MTVDKSSLHASPLISVFSNLVGSNLGGALLGLVYWTLVARAVTPAQLGVGAALVAAMNLLAMLGVVGVGTLLLERFKVVSVGDRRFELSTGLIIAGIGGVLLAAAWLGLSALLRIPGALGHLAISTDLLLVAATGIAAVCQAFDQAVIGMGASSLQLRRNVVASVLRIVIMAAAIALDIRTGQAILVSWIFGLGLSLLASSLRQHLSPRTRVPIKHRWQLVRNHWVVALGHHGLTLLWASSALMLPVVAGAIMPATEVGYFTPARMIAETALALPYFLTLALFATVHGTADFRQKAPRTLVMGIALALSVVGGAAVFGPFILLAFGSNYSRASMPVLLLLLAAGPAFLIKDHFVALRRLQGRRTQGAVMMGLCTVAELGGALAGGLLGGITMLCLGWAATATVCAFFLIPTLTSAIRTQPTAGRTTNSPSDTRRSRESSRSKVPDNCIETINRDPRSNGEFKW